MIFYDAIKTGSRQVSRPNGDIYVTTNRRRRIEETKTQTRRFVSFRVVSCRVVSCRVVSCRVVSCRVVSCRVVSCRVVSRLDVHAALRESMS